MSEFYLELKKQYILNNFIFIKFNTKPHNYLIILLYLYFKFMLDKDQK